MMVDWQELWRGKKSNYKLNGRGKIMEKWKL